MSIQLLISGFSCGSHLSVLGWVARAMALTALLFSTTTALAADAVRCDQTLVTTGATFVEVLERCGEPEHEFARVDFRYPGYTVQVDEWTYAQGRNRFRRVLHFENGRLLDIELRSKPRHSRLSAKYN